MKHILLITAGVALLGCGGGKPYPLDTCIVTGEKLGSHGDPVSIDHEGQQVKFCCAPCIDDFKQEPAKFLAKLNAQPEPKTKPEPQAKPETKPEPKGSK